MSVRAALIAFALSFDIPYSTTRPRPLHAEPTDPHIHIPRLDTFPALESPRALFCSDRAYTQADDEDEEAGIMSETWPSAVPNRLGAVALSTNGEATVSFLASFQYQSSYNFRHHTYHSKGT